MRRSYFTPLLVALECHASFSPTFAGILLRRKLSSPSDWFTFQVESLRNHIECRQGNGADDENHDCAQPCRTPQVKDALIVVDVRAKPVVCGHIGRGDFRPVKVLVFNAALK